MLSTQKYPKSGRRSVSVGEAAAVVESVKAASEV